MKFKVDDDVKVVGNPDRNIPEKNEMVGNICRITRVDYNVPTEYPYHVADKNGDSWWFRESDLETPLSVEELSSVAKRFNSGKVDFTLLPVKALESEAKVWMMGEQKYGRDNWKKLWGDDTINVCLQSGMRHMVAMLSGEMYDPESGLPHASHLRCNMAMINEYLESCDKVTEVIGHSDD